MGASIIRSFLAVCLLAGAVWALNAGGAAGQEYELPPPPPPAATPFTKLDPFPKVRLVGRANRRGARITRFRVKARVGVILVSRCSPKGKRCPYKERQQQIKGTPGKVKTVRINGLERRFYKTGARLRLYVMGNTRQIGKYTSFKIRARRAPIRHDSCTRGIRIRSVRCPS